ncbi:MAG: prepilin-type N-terminal cleavage/methylation domain-containing protein [Chloroflexi bacterium]|nr:prepilin-type N-terminal cleavage/methylation domain-containing protein [Chloroflexota bacterium]
MNQQRSREQDAGRVERPGLSERLIGRRIHRFPWKSERGFTIIELQVAIALVALMAVAATISTIQVIKYSPVAKDRMTVVRQVQNAGYWISRDVEMAEVVTISGLTYPDFLMLSWMVYGYDGAPSVYHTVVYTLTDSSGGVGKLKRLYTNSAGASEETLIAENIYYEPADTDNTSRVVRDAVPELSVKLTGYLPDQSETREFKIAHRPNLWKLGFY